MKIRKVDDKPMVIHTKEKAKIHAHEPKGAKIKGSNIYTVERGPKTAGAKVTDTDRKKSYRKSTIHQSEPKNKGLSRFKQNLKESNTSIKTKNTNLHIAGRTGALVAGAVTDQVEGGQEVSQAAYLAYEASRPVTGTASKGAALFRKKAAAEAKKRIKKVEAGKKLAKKTAKKAAKDTAKTVAKETAKETAKTTAKVATKTATKAAATAAGTAVAPGVGTAIGMAAGYAAGVSIEVKDETEKLANVREDVKARDKELIDNPEFAITIGKVTYTERVDGGTMMLEAISKCKTGETTVIGKFHGFELLVEKNFLGINYMVLRGKTEYKAELSTSPVGSMVKLENLFNGLHENIDFFEKKIEQYQNDLEASKAEYDKPLRTARNWKKSWLGSVN